MFRTIYASIFLRFASTESILSAFEMLERVDPSKSGVDPKKIDQARRRLAKELVRRPEIDFDFFVK